MHHFFGVTGSPLSTVVALTNLNVSGVEKVSIWVVIDLLLFSKSELVVVGRLALLLLLCCWKTFRVDTVEFGQYWCVQVGGLLDRRQLKESLSVGSCGDACCTARSCTYTRPFLPS